MWLEIHEGKHVVDRGRTEVIPATANTLSFRIIYPILIIHCVSLSLTRPGWHNQSSVECTTSRSFECGVLGLLLGECILMKWFAVVSLSYRVQSPLLLLTTDELHSGRIVPFSLLISIMCADAHPWNLSFVCNFIWMFYGIWSYGRCYTYEYLTYGWHTWTILMKNQLFKTCTDLY